MAFMFENLQVCQKAVDLADRIAAYTEIFPRDYYFLTDHFNRTARSITTNLAHGNGRFTMSDRKHLFSGERKCHGSAVSCGRADAH